MRRSIAITALVFLAGCADRASPVAARPDRASSSAPKLPPPAPSATPASAAPEEGFGSELLGRAALGCSSAADCMAVHVLGGCWAITKSAFQGSLIEHHRAWVEAGLHRPSGSPSTLEEVSDYPGACGPDWAGVSCREGRCALEPSDCETEEGMRRSDCEAVGGRWGGCATGRGRMPGCNLPTTDGGKSCTDSKECEGLCVKGLCTAHRRYKGCGVQQGGRVLCVD